MTLQAPPVLQRIGREPSNPRDVYLLNLDSLADFPTQMGLPCASFLLLLAADTTIVDRARLAARILDAGCIYFCSWGPGCRDMREAVDERYLNSLHYAEDQGVVMSTSHEEETLSSAVEFAVVTAWPDDFYVDECDAVVLAVDNHSAWRFLVRSTAATFVREHGIS